MSDPGTVLKKLRDEKIPFVDLRFTDPRGKWQHLSIDATVVDEDTFADGIMFDGSSIAGWKVINESDMTLMPDPTTVVLDPFAARPSLILICDVVEPTTGQGYSRDPRSAARRAEQYVSYSGVGDSTMWGPEPEFFVFDDVRFDVSMNHTFYAIDHREGPYNTGTDYQAGNSGHRPSVKGGYFPVPPVDSAHDLRTEMVETMTAMGLQMEKHHHEVAPSQHELGMLCAPLLRMADQVQIYKYVVQCVAHAHGQTATFLPKPVVDDNGSGMHVHQSIWKDDTPIFAGSGYSDLSETALHYTRRHHQARPHDQRLH